MPEEKQYRYLYNLFLLSLAILIILTPRLVSSGPAWLAEEMIEMMIIGSLLAIFFAINSMREESLRSCDISLRQAWSHVGRVNLLIERVRSAIVSVDKYPKNRRDLKRTLQDMGDKVLGLSGSGFVFFRLINKQTMQTLSEFAGGSRATAVAEQKFSNRALLRKNKLPGMEVFSSAQKNVEIRSFCIIEQAGLTEESRAFIQKIVDDLAALFVIFESQNSQQ